MLHTRLHTYINHLCDGNKSPSESLPSGDGTSTVELEKPYPGSYTKPNFNSGTNMFQANPNLIQIPSSLSTEMSPEMKHEHVSSPLNELNSSSTCVSGKSSPIGRKLQQLSINENENSLLLGFGQPPPISSRQYQGQTSIDNLSVVSSKSTHANPASSTNTNIVQIRDSTSASILTNSTTRNNPSSNPLEYDIF